MVWKSKRGWIGVDIGASAVKAAQLTADRGGWRLSAASVSPRSAAEPSDSPRQLAQEFTAARALAERLRGSRAAATLSMSECQVEPSGDATAAADRCWARWNAGPSSDYTLSVDSQRVDDAVEAISLAGWRCEAIDGQPLAIARALRFSPDYHHDELLGAIDLGATCTTFIASSQGSARYVRRLSGGGMTSVYESVAQSLAIPTAAVGKLLRQHSAPHRAGDAEEDRLLRAAAREAVQPLVQELKRTLEHLAGKLRRAAPQRVFVFGEGGTIAALPALLGDGLGVTVEPWRAAALRRDEGVADLPDCLLGQAIALSALAWDASREGPP